MYQTEHDELFASIRNGKPINNGEYMAKSTLLAIMGRMAAYTGQQITWEMAMNSKEDLSPPVTTGMPRPPTQRRHPRPDEVRLRMCSTISIRRRSVHWSCNPSMVPGDLDRRAGWASLAGLAGLGR